MTFVVTAMGAIKLDWRRFAEASHEQPRCFEASLTGGTDAARKCRIGSSAHFSRTRNRREATVTTAASKPSNEFNWDTIELAPDLPLSVFTSMEPWYHERIGALALYCSDGRWG